MSGQFFVVLDATLMTEIKPAVTKESDLEYQDESLLIKHSGIFGIS